MLITPIKTKKITADDSLEDILDNYITKLSDSSVVAITSKIISLTRGYIKQADSTDHDELIETQADQFLPRSNSQYNVYTTVKNNIFVSNAGIDISNGNGYYTLWPEDPQAEAESIWNHLRKKHNISSLGIIITDSVVVPLRWGTRGVCIGWCGLEPLRSYIGKPDAFGRPLEFSKASVIDGLSSAAVYAMGEGAEQTPLVHITDAPGVTYMDRPPTQEEVNDLKIQIEDDLFAPILTSVQWKQKDSS